MYIVSSCLAGINSRYDGKNSENATIVSLVRKGEAIPLCPEQLGGLSTPRPPCEITTSITGEKQVFCVEGQDYTKEFILGAEKTLGVIKALGVKKAILKSKSPSCGCCYIYSGKFNGELVKGNGITVDLLIENGIEVYSEKDIDSLNI